MLVEKHIVEREEIWTVQATDNEGSRTEDATDYNIGQNTTLKVKTVDLDLKSVLGMKAVEHNKQRSLDPSDDYNEKDLEMTPGEELFQTIRSNDPEADKVTRVTKIFERAPTLDVNFQGINNNTSLHIAVFKRELQVIEILVNKKARTDIKNDNNKSPLDVAKSLKREDIVQILEPNVQQILDEEKVRNNQENNDKINKKLDRQKGVSRLTDGELPSDKDRKFKKYDQATKGKSNKLAYEKRSGTAGMHGQLYEIELLMLLLLQAETKESVKKINGFYLATNMQEAGDFDDVVFKYKYSENGVKKSNIIFLQAKHKEAESEKRFTIDTLLSRSEKGDFLLRKYLSSYIKIKQLQSNGIHPLFQDSVDKSDFVIYTNSVWNFDKSSDCVKKKKVRPENIFHFAENPEKNYYKLNANETVKSALRHSLDFEVLVRELAQSVYSGSIESSKLIFKDYQVSLADRVIQISEKNKGECKFRQDFLDGAQDEEFSRAFLEEIRRNKNFSKTFYAKSDNELKEELRNRIIKLPGNFGREQDNMLKLPLPNKTIPDEIIEEFLSMFKLFINQPNVNHIKDAIKSMIKNVFEIEQKDSVSLIYFDVHSKITKWWRQQGKVEYLTENEKLFNKAKENLSNMKLFGLAILHTKRIKSLGFNFKRYQIQRLTKLIREKRILNIISCRDAVLLSTAKVYQVLERMAEYKSEDDNYKYIFLSLTSVLELQNKVISAFKSEKRNLLVIECKGTETNFGELYDQLVDTVKQNSCKNIILITLENDPFAKQFKRDFSQHRQYEEKIDGNNTLAHLDSESQEIVRGKQVIFQGIKMELGTLVDENSNHLIGADVLSKLINHEKIEVGKKLDDLGEVKYYYIDRIFHRRVTIGKKCFKKTNINDIFVVSNLKESEFSLLAGGEKVRKFTDTESHTEKPSRFITLDDDENVQENLKQLYTKYQTYNIHWLKKDGYKFTWQQSHGSLSNLREFVDAEDIDEYPLDKMTNTAEKVVIVSAEPGMGKSVLLTKLARKQKKADPSLWILRINLNDCTKQLNERNFDKSNLTIIINFLSEIIDLKSPLEKALFKHRVENQGKIAFLFDGFDEISPNYNEKVIALVKFLRQTKVDKLWITTRPHMRDELEDNLSVLSYTLKPLSAEDQKHFLKRFWARKLDLKDDTDDNRLNTYIKELLKVFSLSIGDEERNFTGIPWQTRMVAEVYQDKIKESCNFDQSVPNLPSKLNLLNLYQSFIYKKYDLYWLEKNKVDTTIPSVNKAYEQYRSKFILQHQLLALQVLFSNREIRLLLSAREQALLKGFIEEIMKGSENTGIIISNFNETLNFIHRTIAEYLAAFWLADKRESQEVRYILRYKLFETENRVLRNFFDRMLASDENNTGKNEIHTAVLNYDAKRVEELSLGPLNREVDKGGRTALHLAAAYGFTDIAEILLDNDPTGFQIEDQIFGWRPLSYADKGSHWHVAELLLQRGANTDDMSQAISNINSVHRQGETLLHIAAAEGLSKFTEFLVQRNANIHAKSSNNRTPLHYAASRGNLDVAKFLTEQGAAINCRNSDGDTVLHSAAYEGNLDVVKFLIEKGTNLNYTNNHSDTVLHCAVKKSNLDVVKLLIEKGADLNCQNKNGDTVLHNAALWSNLNVTKFLMEKGADLNIKNNNADSVLHSAAFGGNLDIVKFLIDKGADFNIKNKYGGTVLHSAAEKGSLDVVEFLLLIGADFNCTTNNGDTVLHSAADKGNWHVVKFLLQRGADFNCRNNKDETILHYAAKKGSLDIVEFLTEKGADFDLKNKNGDSVLHSAAFGGNLDVVKFLMEKGANSTCINNYGDTVLHSAAKNGNWDVVKFLILKGADFNCKNNDGDTILHCTAKKGSLDVVEFLTEKGADFKIKSNNNDSVLHSAAFGGNLDVVKYLIKQGVHFNCKNNNGDSVLHSAAYGGNLDVVKFLVEKGSAVNCQNSDGDSVLHSAAFGGYLDVVMFLTQKGADFNCKNKYNDTILHSAAFGDNLDVVTFLIEKGTDFNCQNSDGDTVLHSAAKKGNLGMVKFLIEKGADVNCRNNNDDTAMHYAAKEGNWDVVKFLIEKGADFNRKNNNDDTVLHSAAKDGNWDVVKFLIRRGAAINCQNSDGDTVLHAAVEKGNLDIVEFLLLRGANCNCKNNNGNTILHYAAKNGNLDVVKLLIKKGADLNCNNKNDYTVLHFAAKDDNWDVVKFLILRGAAINCQNSDGDTVLHFAAEKGSLDLIKFLIEQRADSTCINKYGDSVLHYAAKNGNLDVVKFLIKKGADFKCKNNNDDTILHYAAEKGNLDVIEFLTEKGADFNLKNNYGDSVLHSAAFGGNLEVVKFLVEKGADSSCINKYGDTVLHSAAKNGNWDVLKFLILRGTDLNCKDNFGDSVLHSAAEKGSLDMVEFLAEKKADFNCQNSDGDTVLHSAALGGNLDVVKFLILNGVDFNCKNKHGDTVLHSVAEKGNLDVVKFLVEKGADINCKNKLDNSVLHSAAIKGNLDVVRFLVEKGADFNCKNKYGDTVLHSAAFGGNLDVVRFLVGKGADFNCKNNNGNTVLHDAAYWNNLNVVKFLLLKGANITSKNEYGDSVLHSAAKKGNWDVVKFLILRGADFTSKNKHGDTVLLSAAEKGNWNVVNLLIRRGAVFNTKNENSTSVVHDTTYNNYPFVFNMWENIWQGLQIFLNCGSNMVSCSALGGGWI